MSTSFASASPSSRPPFFASFISYTFRTPCNKSSIPSVTGIRPFSLWISNAVCGRGVGKESSQRMARRNKSNLAIWDGLRGGKTMVDVDIDWRGYQMGLGLSLCGRLGKRDLRGRDGYGLYSRT